jgi:MoaA/NifB/PqqE/SkfB family radical SAM enzyme
MENAIAKGESEERFDTAYHKEREHFANLLYSSEELLPHRYVFVLTNKCNLRCDFCFQDKRALPNAMTADDWKNLVDQLPPYAWVTLTGGEPLFFPEFREIFSYIASKFKCNIISNGLLLTPELIDFLLTHENFKTLSISVDNIGNTVRDVKKNQWKHVEEMMRYFKSVRNGTASKAILDAKTVVLDSNSAELLEIHKYCTETLSCDTHSFQLLKGSPLQHADIMFPMEDMYKKTFAPTYQKWGTILEQLNKVRLHMRSYGTRCYVHPKIVNLDSDFEKIDFRLNYINSVRHNPRQFEPCKAMWESVHVNADGEIFPCMAVSIGNIKQSTLTEIIAGEKNKHIRNEIRSFGTVEGCNRCGYLKPQKKM